MQTDSLKKRYTYKVMSKLLAAPIMMLTQALVPRGLGPAAYGQFTFLTNFFQQVITFFDSGTSLAFYTRLSQKPDDKSLIKFYNGFSLASTTIICVFTFGVLVTGRQEWLFPGQHSVYIWLAVFYAALVWFTETINRIVDAYGYTVKGEKILVLQRGIGLILLLIIYFLGYFNLESYFIYNYIVLFFLIGMWAIMLNRKGVKLLKIPTLSGAKIKENASYFWTYSSPLLVYSMLTMLVSLFDNWVLIKISGSIQQGYFGLAFRLSSISFLFTGAMAQLITREFSIAHGNSDKTAIARLFKRLIPPLYVVVSFLSVFFAMNAGVITLFFGGNDFAGAVVAIAIMSLFPIHQTYGQLSGSLFYATGQTRLYRNIGIAVVPLSLLLTYLLITPKSQLGLEMGAIGLALKMVGIQFITVNIQLFFNTRYLSLNFWWFLGHQLLVIIILTTLAYVSKLAVLVYFTSPEVAFVLNGVLYSILSCFFFYLFPGFISMQQTEIKAILLKVLRSLKLIINR